jgi:UDP-N-acetylmuramyl pentapeptide phosphotransferase/UDP-N-acetylglucosamine-1-phosphate transferase
MNNYIYNINFIGILSVIIFFFSFLLFYIYIYKNIYKNNFFYKKSDHKSHKKKVVNNGGIIAIPIFLLTNLFFYFNNSIGIDYEEFSSRYYLLFFGISCLFILSIIDEAYNISAKARLFAQITITVLIIPLFKFPIFSFIPLKLELFIIAYLIVYIINITNFIDGTDGALGITTLIFHISIIIFSIFDQKIYPATIICIISSSILLAFLIFNKPIAKIFMGDTGSIPFGLINAYLIIFLLQKQLYIFSIILFFYPVLDVTLTMIRKICNKIPPWQRLFDYYFLNPVIHGNKSHTYVFNKLVLISLLNTFCAFIFYFTKNNYILLLLIFNFLLIYQFSLFKKK